MENMVCACFLKAGIGFNYSYTAGKVGYIDEGKFAEMELVGVVRLATKEEIARHELTLEAEKLDLGRRELILAAKDEGVKLVAKAQAEAQQRIEELIASFALEAERKSAEAVENEPKRLEEEQNAAEADAGSQGTVVEAAGRATKPKK